MCLGGQVPAQLLPVSGRPFVPSARMCVCVCVSIHGTGEPRLQGSHVCKGASRSVSDFTAWRIPTSMGINQLINQHRTFMSHHTPRQAFYVGPQQAGQGSCGSMRRTFATMED